MIVRGAALCHCDISETCKARLQRLSNLQRRRLVGSLGIAKFRKHGGRLLRLTLPVQWYSCSSSSALRVRLRDSSRLSGHPACSFNPNPRADVNTIRERMAATIKFRECEGLVFFRSVWLCVRQFSIKLREKSPKILCIQCGTLFAFYR